MKKIWRFRCIALMILAFCFMICHVPAAAASQGINNIVLRAYQQVNMMWSPLKDVKGYKDSSGTLTGTFRKGVTYRGVPYGQQVDRGKYIPHEASFNTFLLAVKNENSAFYTTRGKYGKRNSPYYASDCSAFLTYCYGLPRMVTSSIATSKLFAKVPGNSILNAQVGDCYNKSGSHCALITKMTYDAKGNLTSVEICEQTPPKAKKTVYTPAEIQKKIKSRGYTLLRYRNRDLVQPPVMVDAGLMKLPEKKTIKVTQIRLTGINMNVAKGKKLKLSAQVLPKNADNRSLRWTTSDKTVATVSSKGVVKGGKYAGGKSAIITATAADGSGVKASYQVMVMKGIVKKISISGNKSVNAGENLFLDAKVTASKGADRTLIWTSSNTRYATVVDGLVTAKAAGKGHTVKITAAATDGSDKKKTVKIKIR